jgi:hypothetical protein
MPAQQDKKLIRGCDTVPALKRVRRFHTHVTSQGDFGINESAPAVTSNQPSFPVAVPFVRGRDGQRSPRSLLRKVLVRDKEIFWPCLPDLFYPPFVTILGYLRRLPEKSAALYKGTGLWDLQRRTCRCDPSLQVPRNKETLQAARPVSAHP